jgi:hypothetical protein
MGIAPIYNPSQMWCLQPICLQTPSRGAIQDPSRAKTLPPSSPSPSRLHSLLSPTILAGTLISAPYPEPIIERIQICALGAFA